MATVRLALEGDASRVADIYTQGISERGSTFETRPRTAEEMARRIQENPARFPLFVAEESGVVIGWAGIGPYRPRDCYVGVGEFSVYLDRGARRRGLGKLLLGRLIEEAACRGYWKLVSRIFPFNTASLALCRSCGFREVGVYEKHAQLDGAWLDVVIVERLITENQS